MRTCLKCGKIYDDTWNICIHCNQQLVDGAQEIVTPTISHKEETKEIPAGFWIRVGAYLIDCAVFIPLIALSFFNFYVAKNIFLMLLTNIPWIIYKPFMESYYGATLGKMAFSISIVDSNNKRLSLTKAYVRFIPFLIVALVGIIVNVILFSTPDFKKVSGFLEMGRFIQNLPMSTILNIANWIIIIDCIVVAFTHRKRALHDIMAGSFCIRRPYEKKPTYIKILITSIISIIAIVIIGLMLAVAIPNFTMSRERAMTALCRQNLILLRDAEREYARENALSYGASIPAQDQNGNSIPDVLERHLKTGVYCPKGGHYSIGKVGELPTCSIGNNNTDQTDDDHMMQR